MNSRRPGSPLLRTTLKRSGGSLIMTVPAPARDALGLSAGQEMEIGIEGGAMLVTPAQPKPSYTLAELLAQCDPNAD